MIHKSIGALDPAVQSEAGKIYDESVAALMPGGYQITIIETKRELATQMAYRTRGLGLPPNIVREFFKAAGLWELTDEQTRQEVTRTLKSAHIDGRAFDVSITKSGRWVNPDIDKYPWEIFGRIAEKHGWTWGGRWDEVPGVKLGWDPGHVERPL